MSLAARILVLGGIANLVLSYLLGWVLSAKRMKEPMDRHRWLLVAHEVALQEGLLLLGLAVALAYVRLPVLWAQIAAGLLVAASAFQDASGILNWMRGVQDQFAARSSGWIAATINAFMNTAGLLIVAVGAVRAM